MAEVHLRGEITSDGQLKVELPPGLPVGEVEITLEFAEDWWADEDFLRELMEAIRPQPATGAEIAAMLQAEDEWWPDVGDGAEWVAEQRRKRAACRGGS